MRPPTRALELLLPLLIVFGAPPALAAQDVPPSPDGTPEREVWPFELTPYAGAFVPLTDLFEFSAVGTIFGVPARITRVGRQRSSFAIGGRASGWFNARLGVEGTFTYASSDLDVARTIEIPTEPDRIRNLTFGASMWMAAVRVLYRLARIDRSAVVLLGAGPMVISRSGDAFNAPAFGLTGASAMSGTTDVGGVVDLGVRIDASSRVAIRLDAEAYLYSSSLSYTDPFAGGELTSGSKFQTDLVLSAGLAIGL